MTLYSRFSTFLFLLITLPTGYLSFRGQDVTGDSNQVIDRSLFQAL